MEQYSFLYDECTMMKYTEEVRDNCEPFSCGDDDLDEFFNEESFLYAQQLLGKTYCWVTNEKPHQIVAMFTLSNDSIKTSFMTKSSKNKLQRGLPNAKRGRSYPATLLGRIGVNNEFRGGALHIGSQVLAFIKSWLLLEENKNGCRYILVDAYNEENVLGFYARNGFEFLFGNEEDEKLYRNIVSDETLHTRMMYCDLLK